MKLNKSNSLVIIGAYPNTKAGVDVLKKTISSLTNDFDILLSTHYPVDIEIQKLVQYYIYDFRNEIIPHKYSSFIWWWGCKDFYIQTEEKNKTNYHYAVYRLITNAVHFIKDYYEDFYYIESDCVFDKNDIEKLKNIKYDSIKQNKKGSFFGNEEFFNMLVFWFNTEYFLKSIPYFKTPEDFVKATEGDSYLEQYLAKAIVKYDALTNIHLLRDLHPIQYFDKSQLAQLTLQDGQTINFQYRVCLVRLIDSNDIFFIFSGDENTPVTDIKVKIDDELFNIKTGNYTMYRQIFTKSNKIFLEIGDFKKEYFVKDILQDTNSFIKFNG